MSHAAPSLQVNLAALRANYQLLRARHAAKRIAAVVKANAYGLGVETVGKALLAEGCDMFFVATLEEAIVLRSYLPDESIGVFQGILPNEEKEYQQYHLRPVINDPMQIARTADLPSVIVHVDTGMTRLGLTAKDVEQHAGALAPRCSLLMSHLACGNDPIDPKNNEQLTRFHEARRYFPNIAASLANSSGHFLPGEFHFDLGRPGCALYGINPTDGSNPMRPVATLSAPILQIRTLDRDETVGYGATVQAAAGGRIAIVGLGYADGYMRNLSNKGVVFIAGHKASILGRVSMDMVAIDVSHLHENSFTADTRVEFLNEAYTVDDLAKACGTIGYEIFTRLGARVQRVYVE